MRSHEQVVWDFIHGWLRMAELDFIAMLRGLVAKADSALALELASANWLTPFGVEVRYPSLAPEPPAETGDRAFSTARQVRELVMAALDAYLRQGRPTS